MSDDQASTSEPRKTRASDRWRQGVKRFESAEDLVDAIADYLAEIDAENENLKHEQAPARPSFVDLAAFCGIAKTTLSSYTGELRQVLDRFKTLCEASLERHLSDKRFATAGIIFALKNNHDWTDSTRQEITGAEGGPIVMKVSFVAPDPELEAEAKRWDDPDFKPTDALEGSGDTSDS